ncbi:TPA: DnaD domain-containing protein [Listeria monocytogenes]|nr:DnaD domain-containing protein [Listeria monocytogenes]
MSLGWIKLHRDLKEKPIWKSSTPEQKTILVTLLMMANHKENQWEWKGMPFKAKVGQFVTSEQSIVEECGKGITRQNVRTALKRFEKYGFLTKQSTKINSLITIVNWGHYQETDERPNQPTNRQLTNDQPTANQQLTTNKNDKECKNEKNINNIDFQSFWESNGFGPMLPRQLENIQMWVDDFNGNQEIVLKALEVASEQGPEKRNYAYVNRILQNWEKRGFQTVKDVEVAEARRQAENEAKQNKTSYQRSGRKELLPEWFDKQPEASTEQTAKKVTPEEREQLEKEVEEIKRKLREGREHVSSRE